VRVACFSVAAMDHFIQLDRHLVGGNALNQAVRFRQMGHDSAFVGALGTDPAGDQIADLLAAYSIDVSHTHRVSGRTATNQIVNDDAGERYGIEGAWEGGVYEQYRLTPSDWAFMEGFDVWTTHANGPSYADALERKNERQFMAVDFLHLQDYTLLERSLSTGVEVAYFGGTVDMVEDLARVARAYPCGVIVLTLGKDGSIAFQGDRSFTQEALPVVKVVDTTGCGDAFQAGFTATYYRMRDLRASLLAGAELGRETALQHGATPWPSNDCGAEEHHE
jgi:sugar/nucleoside kinase (ribokinase family)